MLTLSKSIVQVVEGRAPHGIALEHMPLASDTSTGVMSEVDGSPHIAAGVRDVRAVLGSTSPPAHHDSGLQLLRLDRGGAS